MSKSPTQLLADARQSPGVSANAVQAVAAVALALDRGVDRSAARFVLSCVEGLFIDLPATPSNVASPPTPATLSWYPEWWLHPRGDRPRRGCGALRSVCRDADGEAPSRWFWQYCHPAWRPNDIKTGRLATVNPRARQVSERDIAGGHACSSGILGSRRCQRLDFGVTPVQPFPGRCCPQCVATGS